MQPVYRWKTYSIVRETHDTVTVVFDTNGRNFPHIPGQYMHIFLEVNNEVISRPYSLNSIEGERPAVTVKRVDGGAMSNYIVDNAEQIEYWDVGDCLGKFYEVADNKKPSTTILIGAGSGMSPIFSILKHELLNTQNKVLLIDANKTQQDVLYAEKLLALNNMFADRFVSYHVYSRQNASGEAGNNVIYSRLTALHLKKIIKTVFGAEYSQSVGYICGPEGFVHLAEECLSNMGISNVKTELFFASKPASALPKESTEVLFHFNDTTYLLDVEPGQSVLQAAIDDKIPVQYSCQSGTCGMCSAMLLSGTVYMAANYALSSAEVADGLRLMCQSYPANNDVEMAVEYQ